MEKIRLSRVLDNCAWIHVVIGVHGCSMRTTPADFLTDLSSPQLTRKNTTECLRPTAPLIYFSWYNQCNKELGCSVDQFTFLLEPTSSMLLSRRNKLKEQNFQLWLAQVLTTHYYECDFYSWFNGICRGSYRNRLHLIRTSKISRF